MYITETTSNVRNLIEELEKKEDINKLKFLIYIFGLLNNDQINTDNELNPSLVEKDDMKIFNFESIGLSNNICTILLQYFSMLYNNMTNTKDTYEDNGNIIGVNYDKEDKEIISKFEKLKFNEKLDLFSEIIIRYDNETYFDKKITNPLFNLRLSGFEMAKIIRDLKI